MKELTIAATIQNIETATDFVGELLDSQDCSMKAHMQIDIAIDELLGNIARYAYSPDTGSVTIRAEVSGDPPCAVITFIDEGIAYNPLTAPDPDVTLAAEDREIGGLGVFMVKKTMDEITYRREDGKNILTIRKAI